MIAVELVEPGTTEPDAALAKAVAAAAHAQGVIVLTCGTYGNVLRFLPPLEHQRRRCSPRPSTSSRRRSEGRPWPPAEPADLA